MAAVVMRTLSSSSTTSTLEARCERRPFPEPKFSGALSGICLRKRGRVHGQNHVEGRAFTTLARDLYAAAVVADDVLRDPQAEPRALRACGEEGLEDARYLGLGDAAPRVADAYGDGRLQSLLVDRGRYRYAPALLHRLLRVEQKVEEDLPQLVCARANLRELLVEGSHDL